MVTIYELLEVNEDASKEDIERAYSRLVLEFRQDIKFDDEKNKENEMIVNKLKLAYEILIDDEKRKKYDYQLAQKRAENLLESVTIEENQEEPEEIEENKEENIQKIQQNQLKSNINNVQENRKKENIRNEDVSSDELTDEEKNRIKRAAQNEFKQNLKRAKKAEEEYNAAYQKAYNDYMRKMGYKVKENWGFKRIVKAIVATFVLIFICFILWHIPFIKNMLVDFYEKNSIIKGLVDFIMIVIDFIFKN